MMCYTTDILEAAVLQIQADFINDDAQPVYELLEFLPREVLEAYLQEDVLDRLKKEWNLEVDKPVN